LNQSVPPPHNGVEKYTKKEKAMEKLVQLFGRSIRFAYWTFILGPKFSRHEREGIDLPRYYYLSKVEYPQNILFKPNHPIHSIFERSFDLGLARITPQRIAHIFGWRITKRTKGKHQLVIEQMDHGHHVIRAYSKNSFVKQYEKTTHSCASKHARTTSKTFFRRKLWSVSKTWPTNFNPLTTASPKLQAQYH